MFLKVVILSYNLYIMSFSGPSSVSRVK